MTTPPSGTTIAVTGGAGYVGSVLVPKLISLGHRVKVLDLFMFGDNVFGDYNESPLLERIKVDIRDTAGMSDAIKGSEAVIHLACISNDPSFELDPVLGKSINFDAFQGILDSTRDAGVKRFIYASSSSVYGVKDEPNVTEEVTCEPLTDYSKYKLLCEQVLESADMGDTEWVIARPSTVCGYANRLRLDVVVNILTINALVKRQIRVFGGEQLRPNINIQDMVRAYETLLSVPMDLMHRETFNIGFQNLKVSEIAELVARVVDDPDVSIVVEPSDDMRSYHVDSGKIERALGFKAQHTVEDAVQSICDAYRAGLIPNAMESSSYYNIRTVQEINLEFSPISGS